MDRELNQEGFKSKEEFLRNEVSFDENDALTIAKRKVTKERLRKLLGTADDVNALLASIEQYCFIILQSLN